MSKIKALEELKVLLEKYKEEFSPLNSVPSSTEVKREIELLKVEEEFGIPLRMCGATHYKVRNSYDDWTGVTYFSKENGRTISWPDNGEQPEEEWLYVISFPTGPYIFGDSYPEKTFQNFFQELKSFGPKYCDTANKSLYFSSNVAKEVYEAFWGILNKHKEKVQEEVKEKRKAELLKELAELSGGEG